ncbi:hypothetical protein D1BOALGB6SA_9352 [Olavius sp. associated proteobacterium Delta 1]|nr:hypothetical protein D1BOALGB6SA_9352 [Olavius sp. associated proteobacterium Delta 1]
MLNVRYWLLDTSYCFIVAGNFFGILVTEYLMLDYRVLGACFFLNDCHP